MNTKNYLPLIESTLVSIFEGKEPYNLYEPIRYVLSIGGKRLRPTFALMSCDLFGGNVNDAVYPACALEVYHNFTLLHDDIMDNADMRRGKPTVHKKWNENTAILSGDVMLSQAYEVMCRAEHSLLPSLLSVFNQTTIEVCEGQQYDMDFESRNDVTADEYIAMIRLKTAVLLAASLKIGAICAKASAKDADLIYEFGINVGLAFQLKDDWLDMYGDVKKFGKKIGGDICCNKKTYLLITALEKAAGDTKKSLTEWISKESFDRDEKVKAVTAIYDSLNIGKIAEEKMNSYYQKALESLSQLSLSADKKEVLKSIAESLLYRED